MLQITEAPHWMLPYIGHDLMVSFWSFKSSPSLPISVTHSYVFYRECNSKKLFSHFPLIWIKKSQSFLSYFICQFVKLTRLGQLNKEQLRNMHCFWGDSYRGQPIMKSFWNFTSLQVTFVKFQPPKPKLDLFGLRLISGSQGTSLWSFCL